MSRGREGMCGRTVRRSVGRPTAAPHSRAVLSPQHTNYICSNNTHGSIGAVSLVHCIQLGQRNTEEALRVQGCNCQMRALPR